MLMQALRRRNAEGIGAGTTARPQKSGAPQAGKRSGVSQHTGEKKMLRRQSKVQGVSFLPVSALALSSAVARSQERAQADQAAQPSETVTVTGSLISNPN